MTALFHPKSATPAVSKPCASDAVFWVSTPAGVLRGSCGPHLSATLTRFLAEGGQTLDLAPEPGTACDWQEAVR